MPVPIGVYRTPAPNLAAVQAYEKFLGLPSGQQVSYVLAFIADNPSWAQFEAGALQANTNGPAGPHTAGDWAPLLGGRRLALAIPACCGGSSWAQEATGGNDVHWRALARTLLTAGLGNATLRVGREFNGSWYPWKVTEGAQGSYKAGYTHIVNLLRSQPGSSFRFCWNPILGTGTLGKSGVESAYPGDDVVDEIGLDVYDGDWSGVYPASADAVTPGQQQQVWGTLLGQWDGLRGWYNLATNHRKPLCFPEWGLRLWKDAGVNRGGGDNAVLVRGMAEFITGCGASWQAMWEDAGMGVCDPDTASPVASPQARAAFLAAFGSR